MAESFDLFWSPSAAPRVTGHYLYGYLLSRYAVYNYSSYFSNSNGPVAWRALLWWSGTKCGSPSWGGCGRTSATICASSTRGTTSATVCASSTQTSPQSSPPKTWPLRSKNPYSFQLPGEKTPNIDLNFTKIIKTSLKISTSSYFCIYFFMDLTSLNGSTSSMTFFGSRSFAPSCWRRRVWRWAARTSRWRRRRGSWCWRSTAATGCPSPAWRPGGCDGCDGRWTPLNSLMFWVADGDVEELMELMGKYDINRICLRYNGRNMSNKMMLMDRYHLVFLL